VRRALPGFAEGAVTRQLRRFFFVRLLLLVERHQTYVGRTLASEHGPRHEVLAQFALPLRKGVRAFPVERELVVLGVMHGLAGIAEAVRDRRAVRLLMLGKLRQCTPTLGRSLRKTLGCRIAGVLEGRAASSVQTRRLEPVTLFFGPSRIELAALFPRKTSAAPNLLGRGFRRLPATNRRSHE